jgi:hypothetical protein
MSTIPVESKKAFFFILGAVAGIYVASLILRKLP